MNFMNAICEIQGVFETMRTYGDKVHKLDAHLERLRASAEIVDLELSCEIGEIRQRVLATFTGYTGERPVRIKVIATPENVSIEIIPFKIDQEIYEGMSAICIETERRHPLSKTFPHTVSNEAHNEAERQGHYEALLVDHDGLVREGAYSNVFWVKNGRVYTVENGVLQGVTRQTVIDHLGNVKFADITPEKLKNADEVFITKTTTGPVPITSIDGHQIGDGQAGPVAKALHAYFLEFESVADEVD